MISGETRIYKGHTVKLYGGIFFTDNYRYELDGGLTIRGNKPRPSARAAWKAAKSEINRKFKAKP